MTVPTVNAYYNPQKNEMVFPAGALVPQTFDASVDDAANYGSLGGSWAGHELTHGFDDEGRHFDAAGNLKDWWAPSDSLKFTREAQKVVDQFDKYIQVDTFHVNGKLTLGENIADFGGLLTAYDALQRALQRNGRPKAIEGFTPEQRFFISYAQSWRGHAFDGLELREINLPENDVRVAAEHAILTPAADALAVHQTRERLLAEVLSQAHDVDERPVARRERRR